MKADLETESLSSTVVRIALVTLGVLAATALMSVNRSPAGFDVNSGNTLGRTDFYRLYRGVRLSIEANTLRTIYLRCWRQCRGRAESRNRRGSSRIFVFTLASILAACGGILAGSRLLAVNQSSGAGRRAVECHRRRGDRRHEPIWRARQHVICLLGALVIGAIANGMDLLALPSSIRFMVTGAVLLLAVTLDAYTRSLRQKTGRVSRIAAATFWGAADSQPVSAVRTP